MLPVQNASSNDKIWDSVLFNTSNKKYTKLPKILQFSEQNSKIHEKLFNSFLILLISPATALDESRKHKNIWK